MNQTNISEKAVTEKTPDKNDAPSVYISPFVTISRGKNSARKEYHKRRSGKNCAAIYRMSHDKC